MFLRLVPDNTQFDFLGKRFICFGASVLTLIAVVVALMTHGLNYGIDFAGGTLVQARLEKTIPVSDLRQGLTEGGWSGLVIQQYGAPDEVMIRIPGIADDSSKLEAMGDRMAKALTPIAGKVEIRRVEYVGPQIGNELKKKALMAILLSAVAILAYVGLRFEFRFAMGALVALLHDVLITVGLFSVLDKEITLPVLAAVLTIIGYSLNDTIVVFDRVRENMRKYKKKPMVETLNISVNEMLNRTLMMSLTTLVVLVALFYFGGEVIHDFAFALLIGVVVGTYSSTYVAAPIALWLERFAAKPVEDPAEKTTRKHKHA